MNNRDRERCSKLSASLTRVDECPLQCFMTGCVICIVQQPLNVLNNDTRQRYREIPQMPKNETIVEYETPDAGDDRRRADVDSPAFA